MLNISIGLKEVYGGAGGDVVAYMPFCGIKSLNISDNDT